MKHIFRSLIVFSLLLSAGLLTGCHRGGLPDGVVGQDRMVDFLADAYMLEGFYAIETQYRYDLVTEEVLHAYDSILDLHGLTREQVERSLDYYTAHLDAYRAINDSVVARLERENGQAGRAGTQD